MNLNSVIGLNVDGFKVESWERFSPNNKNTKNKITKSQNTKNKITKILIIGGRSWSDGGVCGVMMYASDPPGRT